MKIKLTDSKYSNFTGMIGHVQFADGVSLSDEPQEALAFVSAVVSAAWADAAPAVAPAPVAPTPAPAAPVEESVVEAVLERVEQAIHNTFGHHDEQPAT